MKHYRQFTTFNNGKAIIHTNFKLLPDRYIQVGDNEPTPIEDYGDFLLSEDLLTEEQAFERYLSYL